MFGFGIYMYGGLVSFASKQLKTVAFSSCEAEYAAASYTCKEIEFIRNICGNKATWVLIAESNSLDETRQGTATRITDTYRDLYRRLSQGREGGTIDEQHAVDESRRRRSRSREDSRCPKRIAPGGWSHQTVKAPPGGEHK